MRVLIIFRCEFISSNCRQNWRPLIGREISHGHGLNLVCPVNLYFQLKGSLIEHSLLTLSTSIDCKAVAINYIVGDEGAK